MELLVVMAVIALLAALLVPALSAGKGQSQSAACQNRLRQIGIAMTMYVSDYNRYPPLADTNAGVNSLQICFDKFYPYYPLRWTNAVWNCPTYLASGGVVLSGYEQMWIDWCSYAYNWSGTGDPRRDHLGLGFRMDLSQTIAREPEVLAPSQMYAVADTRPTIWSNAPHGNIKMQFYSFGVSRFNSVASQESPPPHDRAYNVLFCDGHVVKVPRTEYLYPPTSAHHWNRDNKPHPETWIFPWAVQN
jgi:prepilin-type processing-associated H-X9-DG protein